MDVQTCLKKLRYVGVLSFATVGLDGTPQVLSLIHISKATRGAFSWPVPERTAPSTVPGQRIR